MKKFLFVLLFSPVVSFGQVETTYEAESTYDPITGKTTTTTIKEKTSPYGAEKYKPDIKPFKPDYNRFPPAGEYRRRRRRGKTRPTITWVIKEKPIIRPIEKFNSAIYASVANSAPYSSNEYDGRVFSFGFEKGLSRNIALRFKYQSPNVYVSEVGYGPSDRNYSCSYDYQAFFLDFKVFDNIWNGLYERSGLEKPGGPWWSPSISFVKLNKERVSGYNAPIQYAEETSFGFGLCVGHDFHFRERFVYSTEILWMKYRNKNILDESRFGIWSISEVATSIGIKLSMSYRFNTPGKRMDKSLINADWIDWWL